ncbi:hypothetical protein COV15_00595 [Candidatus Woesearchaeota archaeon CG10_big_fil_rev_8_21_14_0_10_34_12]|nr:MAG: hypothetical protein COV15_00595 [Candidatus Woesearchaeota archaeon CG10_big_fil_rev_8_21_14_0_10_34_12]
MDLKLDLGGKATLSRNKLDNEPYLHLKLEVPAGSGRYARQTIRISEDEYSELIRKAHCGYRLPVEGKLELKASD